MSRKLNLIGSKNSQRKMHSIKYIKKSRKAIRNIYGLTNTQIDILIFSYDEPKFKQQQLFDNYIAGRDTIIESLPRLIDKDLLYIYSEKKPRLNQARYYRISAKGKMIIERLMRMAMGEEYAPV